MIKDVREPKFILTGCLLIIALGLFWGWVVYKAVKFFMGG
jgi:hypothetical protein